MEPDDASLFCSMLVTPSDNSRMMPTDELAIKDQLLFKLRKSKDCLYKIIDCLPTRVI